MTGGTVLPADISPPPAPGDHDQQDAADQPAEAGQQRAASQPAGTSQPGSGGMPRIFFAEEPDQQHKFVGRPYGQPPGPGQPGPGQPGPGQAGLSQPGQDQPGPGQPAGRARAGGWGRLPGLGQSAQQPGGQRATGPQPRRARPTRPPERELRQRAIASLILGVLSLVALLGLGGDLHRGVYLLIFSAVIGIAGCVIGITAVRKARKTGSYRPRGAIGGIVLGGIAALLSIPILATYLAFPSQVSNYVKCLGQAQSSGAQQRCMDRFYRSIQLGSAAGLTSGAVRPMGSAPAPTGSASARRHGITGRPGSGQRGWSA